MSKENKVGIQNELGIRVPLGRTLIMSTFTVSHDNPKGENPNIDLTAKKWAVWLTSQEIEIDDKKYNFIIGPDGLRSPVAVHWADPFPEIYILKDYKMVKVETDVLGTDHTNYQSGHRVSSVTKRYPGIQVENYTIIQLPPEDQGRELESAKVYFSTGPRPTLISGMKNRGFGNRLATSLWALRLTQMGHPDLPYARELHLG